jgi:hypothetical protein
MVGYDVDHLRQLAAQIASQEITVSDACTQVLDSMGNPVQLLDQHSWTHSHVMGSIFLQYLVVIVRPSFLRFSSMRSVSVMTDSPSAQRGCFYGSRTHLRELGSAK